MELDLQPQRRPRPSDSSTSWVEPTWVPGVVSYQREKQTEGISAVGAVVRDAFGSMGAITIPMPTQRFSGRERELADRLREVAAEATRALGG